MTSRIPENTDWEWFLLICRIKPAHSRCHEVHSRTRDAGTAETSQTELSAAHQLDSGRWKLRSERVPVPTDKEFTRPLVSTIAVGFTMLSPLIFLITAYLWAWVVS
jgi:hypothetical protein